MKKKYPLPGENWKYKFGPAPRGRILYLYKDFSRLGNNKFRVKIRFQHSLVPFDRSFQIIIEDYEKLDET